MARLTVVNDDPDLLDLIGEILEGEGFVTTLIEGVGDDLLEEICQSKPDLLMIDLRHGDDAHQRWRIVQELRRTAGGDLPVVLCSADKAAVRGVEAELEAPVDVATLMLPFEIDDLLQSIRRLSGGREEFRCG